MFTAKQVDQLLKPINPRRVLKDAKGHSHVSQQDILAHLNRVFGFGNFDTEVLSVDLVFEQPRTQVEGKPGGRFDVCYRALVRLTVRDEAGQCCRFENGSTATAQNHTRGDAHDLAYKSAISLSVKRAAIALGDGFGLSLYNRGQMEPLVMGTIVHPTAPSESEDVQEGVQQQVSLGNDEVTLDEDVSPAVESQGEPVRGADGVRAQPGIGQEEPRLASKLERDSLRSALEAAGITQAERRAFLEARVGREVPRIDVLTSVEVALVLAFIEGSPMGESSPTTVEEQS